MKRLLPILIGLCAQTNALAAEDPFAAVEIKSTQVAGTVYMLEGAGGNVGLSIGEDGTLIVDDQFAQLGDKILKAIQALGGNNPRLVLNTHFHGDHTGSNPQFGRGGTIVAHDNVRVRLLSTDGFPRSGLPVVTYDDDATVHFNNETISLIHLPSGHTDGDSAVWLASVPPLGPAIPDTAMPQVVPDRVRTPSAMAKATGCDTAPCSASNSGGTPSRACLALFA